MSDGILEVVLEVVAAIFIIVLGIIIMTYLYPVSPLAAIVGIIALICVAAVVVIGFIRSHS